MNKMQLLLILCLPFIGRAQQNTDTKMTYILKNTKLEMHIDMPLSNYNLSRFDWTGKITTLKYKNIYVTGGETIGKAKTNNSGRGFYNEFGIDAALGYNETLEDGWFHKIGIGLLKKDDQSYIFSKNYDIRPAKFKITKKTNKIIIVCTSPLVNGYAYVLKKEIELLESGFAVKYFLQNTGKKTIVSQEYIHNFLAIDNDSISSNYILKFPFQIKPLFFGETFNPEEKVVIGQKEITFNNIPNEQFFLSNLSGYEEVDACWELINAKKKIGISEKGSFKTSKVNLWGAKHVISPELFFNIKIDPGQHLVWSRTFNIFEIH